jgi:hypothetical protein
LTKGECGKYVRLKQAFFGILKLVSKEYITKEDMKGKKTVQNVVVPT